MDKQVFISGEKVDLRVVENTDAAFLSFCHNSEDVRSSFFTNYPTNSLRQQKSIEQLYEQYDYLPLIIADSKSHENIGVTAFHRIDIVGGVATLSIILPDNKKWGKGYGKETVKLMVHYGFNILNFHRIQLVVAAKNTAARRIYSETGFREEGVMREAMYQNGSYWDFIMMGLLESDLGS